MKNRRPALASAIAAPAWMLVAALAALASAAAASLAADDGDPDSTFSSDGQATYTISSPAQVAEYANAVAALADGSLLVGGRSHGGSTALGDFAVLKYRPGGGVDFSFGSLGSRIVNFGDNDSLAALFVEADGKILLAGSASDGVSSLPPALARLTSGGDLDGSFGTAGKVVVQAPWPSAELYVVETGPRRTTNGRLVFAGG